MPPLRKHLLAIALTTAGSISLAAETTGKLGDAAQMLNNPSVTFGAGWLPQPGRDFSGTIGVVGSPDGKGVIFNVNINGLPSEGGPFSFHIHDQPVRPDGNCDATLAHLDPYQRGQEPPCDSSRPETCEVGDLSGKHGRINGTSVEAMSFTEMYATLEPGIGAFFGNRSVVIHFANTTRFACANFTKAGCDFKQCGPIDFVSTPPAATPPPPPPKRWTLMNLSRRNWWFRAWREEE